MSLWLVFALGATPSHLLFSSSHAWPLAHLDWSSTALHEGLDLLRLGATRFPGGTGSDCWDWSNKTAAPNYLPACLNSAAQRAKIAAAPGNFSVAHFEAMVVPHLAAKQVADRTVYVINIYSAANTSAGSVQGLIESLATQVSGQVDFLELGNELYFKGKRDRLPNAQAYLDAVRPAVARAKQLWPNVHIALSVNCLDLYNTTVPSNEAGEAFANGPSPLWNKHLGRAFASWEQRALVDAVACHDYTLKFDTLAAATAAASTSAASTGSTAAPAAPTASATPAAVHWPTVVAVWPQASTANARRHLTSYFAGAQSDAPTDVWQTESGIPFFAFGKAAPSSHVEQAAFDFLNTTTKLGVLQVSRTA
jgi:hypothetical protein